MPRLRRYKLQEWAEGAVACVEAHRPDVIAFDTETSGVAYYDEPFCASFTWRVAGELCSAYISLEDEFDGAAIVRRILGTVPTWVAHNAKFDCQKLLLIDALPEDWQAYTIHDTQLLFHLLDENSPKGLKALAVSVLKEQDTVEVEVKSGANKGQLRRVPREQHELRRVRSKLRLKVTDGYHLLPREVVIPYAVTDARFTLRLFETLWPRFEQAGAQDPALMQLYHSECELMQVLLHMEAHGMGVNVEYVDAKVAEYGVRVMEGLCRVTELAGRDDPKLPNSPKQIKAVLAEMGEEMDGTGELFLRQLIDSGRNLPAVEFAEAVLALRSDSKVYRTYLKAIQTETREAIYHPNFNPVAAKTGRMSSSTARN